MLCQIIMRGLGEQRMDSFQVASFQQSIQGEIIIVIICLYSILLSIKFEYYRFQTNSSFYSYFNFHCDMFGRDGSIQFLEDIIYQE